MGNYWSIILISWFFVLSVFNVTGQQKGGYDYDKYQGKFDDLINNPNAFSSLERTEIYLIECSQYLSTNKDSAYIMFDSMLDFGISLKDNLVIGQALASKAQLLQLDGQWNESIALYERSIPYLKDYPNFLALRYGAIASNYQTLNQLDSADHYSTKALSIVLSIKDSTHYTTLYSFKANILASQKRFDSSIKNYQKALEFKSFAPSLTTETFIHRDIAGIFAKIEDYKSAEYHIKTGLKIAEANGYSNLLSDFRNMLGFQQLKQDKYRKALNNLLIAHRNIVKKKRGSRLLENHLLIALSYDGLDKKDSLRHYLELVKKLPNRGKISHNNSILLSLSKAKLAHANGALVQAEKHYKAAISSTSESDFSFFSKKAHLGLIELYKNQKHWLKADALKDSIIGKVERKNIVSQQRIIYDFEKKYQKEIQDQEITLLNNQTEIQTLELDRKSRLLYFSLLGLLLAGLAGFGIIFAYRTKAKSNDALRLKNQQLSEALETNKMLIKEIHHRVKNNLQVVSSLLNLQSRFEKDNTIVKAINTGKYRVQSMSLLHQNLYVNEDLNSISIKKYFEDLANSLVSEYPSPHTQIRLKTDIDEIELDVDTLVPLGLIANELITNSLKYAFNKQKDGLISFTIKEVNDQINMIVADNGDGIPFSEIPKRSKSMGFQLIQSFASKLKADIHINNEDGTEIALVFKRKSIVPKLKNLKNVAG